MKKILLILILGFFALSFTSVNNGSSNSPPEKSTAQVNQVQGLYIFTDSKPVLEYEYLGTVKAALTLRSPQYTDVRDKLIRKAKEEFPGAEGVILNFKTGASDQADVIKFK